MARMLGLMLLVALGAGCATRSDSVRPAQATAGTPVGHGKPEKIAAATKGPDAVRCEIIDKTGTRIGTRVCMTNKAWAAHWKQTSMDSQQALEQAKRIGAMVDAR